MRVVNDFIACSQLLRVVRAFSELPQLRVAGLELSELLHSRAARKGGDRPEVPIRHTSTLFYVIIW